MVVSKISTLCSLATPMVKIIFAFKQRLTRNVSGLMADSALTPAETAKTLRHFTSTNHCWVMENFKYCAGKATRHPVCNINKCKDFNQWTIGFVTIVLTRWPIDTDFTDINLQANLRDYYFQMYLYDKIYSLGPRDYQDSAPLWCLSCPNKSDITVDGEGTGAQQDDMEFGVELASPDWERLMNGFSTPASHGPASQCDLSELCICPDVIAPR